MARNKILADMASQDVTAAEFDRLDGIGSAAVGISDTQTLTNKTISSGTIGSGVTNEMTGSVVHVQYATLTGDTSNSTTTSWTDTGLEITVSAANAAKGSQIIILLSHNIAVNVNHHALIDYRVYRTGTGNVGALSLLFRSGVGLAATSSGAVSNHRPSMPIGDTCVDDISSAGAGNFIYDLQFRTHNADGDAAGPIYYKYTLNSVSYITAMVIA